MKNKIKLISKIKNFEHDMIIELIKHELRNFKKSLSLLMIVNIKYKQT